MKPIVKIGFLFQDILIILLEIKVHASFRGKDVHTVTFDTHRHSNVSTLY